MRIRKTTTTVVDIKSEEDEDVRIDGLALNTDGNLGVLSQAPCPPMRNRSTVFYYDYTDLDDEEGQANSNAPHLGGDFGEDGYAHEHGGLAQRAEENGAIDRYEEESG